MNYKNDDDYIQGGHIGVDIARRGTRLFSFSSYPKKFFFRTQTADLPNGLRIRLSNNPFLFVLCFSKKQKGDFPKKGEAAAEGRVMALGFS
jgi:hypothetical protein